MYIPAQAAFLTHQRKALPLSDMLWYNLYERACYIWDSTLNIIWREKHETENACLYFNALVLLYALGQQYIRCGGTGAPYESDF